MAKRKAGCFRFLQSMVCGEVFHPMGSATRVACLGALPQPQRGAAVFGWVIRPRVVSFFVSLSHSYLACPAAALLFLAGSSQQICASLPKSQTICTLRSSASSKLTWLALAEDHAALSRSLEQLMALLRPVKVKRMLLASLAAKFLAPAGRARALAIEFMMRVGLQFLGRCVEGACVRRTPPESQALRSSEGGDYDRRGRKPAVCEKIWSSLRVSRM